MKYLLLVHDKYKDDNDFPLAEAYLSSVLRENGHEVDVCCQDIYHQSNEDIIKTINDNQYDYVGLGFLSARYIETIRPLCHLIKSNTESKLVLGGHGASSIPEFILKDTGADILVIGEAENTISNLKGKNGIVYSKPVKNLDNIPEPAWDLFPMDIYSTTKQHPGQFKNEKSINISTSRGCTNRCSFCYRLEKGIRLRDVYKIVDEIEYLNNKYDINYFYMTDELFVLSKKRLKEFKEELKRRRLDIGYWCNSRVNIINKDLLNVLKDTGCRFLNFGFESMDQNVLDAMRKNTTILDNIRAAKLTKEFGLKMGLNFIWGMPQDSYSSLRKNVEFIKRFNTYEQIRTIRPVTPYPGCPLYYQALESGKLKGPQDFYKKFKNSDLVTVNFTNMDTQDMYKYLLEANKELIYDHMFNTDLSIQEAESMIESFRKLYKGKNYKFRGIRHYEK